MCFAYYLSIPGKSEPEQPSCRPIVLGGRKRPAATLGDYQDSATGTVSKAQPENQPMGAQVKKDKM